MTSYDDLFKKLGPGLLRTIILAVQSQLGFLAAQITGVLIRKVLILNTHFRTMILVIDFLIAEPIYLCKVRPGEFVYSIYLDLYIHII